MTWETVHIFISSTFNDMHAERDDLVKRVFPRLREWCARRKLHLVDIDLRWGVTEADATHNRRVVQVCLERIDQCRPFFVCLLGQRYGWVPRREDVSEETLARFPGLAEAIAERRSVTDLEVLHAAARPFHSSTGVGFDPVEHAFFYLRDPSYLAEVPDEPGHRRRIFSDTEETDPELREFLRDRQRTLVDAVIPATGRPVRRYLAHWLPGARTPELALPLVAPSTVAENRARWRAMWRLHAGVEPGEHAFKDEAERAAIAFNERLTSGRLGGFSVDGVPLGEVIASDLQAAIEARFPGRAATHESELQQELDQHEQFRAISAQGYIERAGDFDALDAYVAGDSTAPFLLTAGAGSGKSTLLATWAERCESRLQLEERASLHCRFIGQSDGSTNVHSLIRLLCLELAEVAGKIGGQIPEDPRELHEAWPDLLTEAGRAGKTIIVIDAMDQLAPGLADVTWLPARLPAGTKLVVSCKSDGDTGTRLVEALRRRGVIEAEVRLFESLDDRRRLVRAYLSQYLKELDEHHLTALVESPAAANPLYLKVVLSELRVFGAYGNLGDKLRSDFGDTPGSAFEAVLARLESDPSDSAVAPAVLVPLLFGLLAHARRGLSVAELAAMFRAHLGLGSDASEQMKESIELLLRQLRLFLARRDDRHDFFFDSFRSAARARYTTDQERTEPRRRTSAGWHDLLAGYFESVPLVEPKPAAPRDDHTEPWRRARRKLAELPYHLRCAARWEDLAGTLCDLDFIAAKALAGMVVDLEEDYAAALQAWPGSSFERACAEVAELQEFVTAHAHLLMAHPRETIAIARNSASQGLVATLGAARAEALERPWIAVEPRPQRSTECLRIIPAHGGRSVNDVAILPDAKRAISVGDDAMVRLWDLTTGRCIHAMSGHDGEVGSVVLDRDGRTAFTAGRREMCVWDVATGALVRKLDGYFSFRPAGIDLSADGRIGAVVTGRYLDLFDLETGQQRHRLEGRDPVAEAELEKYAAGWAQMGGGIVPEDVSTVVLDGAGKVAVTNGNSLLASEVLRVWDASSGALLAEIQTVPRSNATCVAMDEEGTVLIAAHGHRLEVWDFRERAHVRTLGSSAYHNLDPAQGHTEPVCALALDREGELLASAGADRTVRLWDVETGRCLRVFEGHDHQINGVALARDHSLVASASRDGTVRFWDPQATSSARTRHRHAAPVRHLVIDPKGRHALSSCEASEESRNRQPCRREGGAAWTAPFTSPSLWDLHSGDLRHQLRGHEWPVEDLAFAGKGELAVSVEQSHSASVPRHYPLCVWETGTGTTVRSLEGWDFVVPSPDGRLVVTRTPEGLTAWDLSTGAATVLAEDGRGHAGSAAIGPDCRTLVTSPTGSGRDFDLRFWDIATGRRLGMVAGPENTINALMVLPDCRAALAACPPYYPDVWLFRLAPGARHQTLSSTESALTAIALAPQGRSCASGSRDGTLRLWNLATLGSTAAAPAHAGAVTAIAFAAHGASLISAGKDGDLRVWDVASLACIAVHPTGHEVTALSPIRPDGRFVCGLKNGELRFLELREPEQRSPVTTAAWSAPSDGGPAPCTAICPWCAERFALAETVAATLDRTTNEVALPPEASPCLDLPAEAWHEAALETRCARCGQPVRLNPMVAGVRG